MSEYTDKIAMIRRLTGASLKLCADAFSRLGDVELAKQELLKGEKPLNERGHYGAGYIHVYQHHNGQMASMVALRCGTDFVARTDEFKALARRLALEVAALHVGQVPDGVEDLYKLPVTVESGLLDGDPVPARSIGDAIADLSRRTGEPVAVGTFAKWEI